MKLQLYQHLKTSMQEQHKSKILKCSLGILILKCIDLKCGMGSMNCNYVMVLFCALSYVAL